MLVDKHGAIFGSVLLLITLAVLVGTSTIGVPVWEVTVPPALVMLVRDSVYDWLARNKPESSTSQPAETLPSHRASSGQFSMTELSRGDVMEVQPESKQVTSRIEVSSNDPNPTVTEDSPDSVPSPPSTRSSSPTPPGTLYDRIVQQIQHLCNTFPTVTTIVSRLPIPLLPFAFLMFILVQALSTQGWVEVFTRWWAAWVSTTGPIGAIGGMGFIACIFCNVSFLSYYCFKPNSFYLVHITRYAAQTSVQPSCSLASSKTGSPPPPSIHAPETARSSPSP